MKTLSLLFVLFLLALFGSTILFDLAYLEFSLETCIIYTVVTFIIYLVLRVVGGSLNKKFEKHINNFLNGETANLFNDKGLLRVFGFLLFVMLPFLFFIFAVSFFDAICFGFIGLEILSILPRVPLFLLVGLGVIVLGTAIAILIGLFYLLFPPGKKTFGIPVGKDIESKLWLVMDEVADQLKTKPVNKIILKPDSGIGVYLEGNTFSTILGRSKRVLEIGLPSLNNLTVNEFKVILAHEYGHFNNKDTHWSVFTYSMGSSLLKALKATPGPNTDGNNKLILSFNPAFWILLAYVNLFFKITSGFSRIREVMSDIGAIELYGGKTFSDALLKVATNDTFFTDIENKYLEEALSNKDLMPEFSEYKKIKLQSVDQKELNEIRSGLLNNNVIHDEFDTHPALKSRLDYSRKFKDIAKENDKNLVYDIFDDWEKISKEVSTLYDLRTSMLIKLLKQQVQTA
jgi:Zn-dependent protease with chaperone function